MRRSNPDLTAWENGARRRIRTGLEPTYKVGVSLTTPDGQWSVGQDLHLHGRDAHELLRLACLLIAPPTETGADGGTRTLKPHPF